MARGLLSNGAAPSIVDCAAILDSSITNEIAELLQMGVLVSIGTTRDRGAVSITVTADGDWDREYFRRSEDASDWLRRAVAILRDRELGEPVADLPARQTPTRRRQKLT